MLFALSGTLRLKGSSTQVFRIEALG